jgi:SAM-dependent methyltransferase
MDSTQRFSTRVGDYVKFRPSYPVGVLDLLESKCGLGPGARVADVGSGTGILTQLLLDRGAQVFAIEPNEPMRFAAEQTLLANPRFTSLDARAEATGLPDHSIDLYTASQAFHWFDPPAARQECLRILRPGGWAALIWNGRDSRGTEFLTEYEELLESLPAYQLTRHRNLPRESMASFMAPSTLEVHSFSNSQRMDWEGTLGRAASSSYFPRPEDEEWAATVEVLRDMFDRHSQDGTVDFLYECQTFLGQPAP